MAELKKVVASPELSRFMSVAPDASGIFKALADSADSIYQQMLPAAKEKAALKGDADGREVARSQIGSKAGGTDYAGAIKSVESGGNYGALGPVTKNGDRAYGAYQVMGANIPAWTEKHVGRRMTPDEFLKDQAAQDAVFNGEFGSYVTKYGNPQDAASMWFSGRPMSEAGTASDGMTTVPEYVQKFNAALGNGQATIIRAADGKLESRLFSPGAPEVRAAHDVAASAAYVSEMMSQGVNDMMGMSDQFPSNPEGFKQAGIAYINDVVSKAPEKFRPDLRISLEKELDRRYLGALEDKHSEIRQRADNSSQALMVRFQDNLSRAIASGNTAEIESAAKELDGVLALRERLPGVSWTPEQSQNVRIKANEDALKIKEQKQKDDKIALDGKLDLIIASAANGQHAADENILSDPAVQNASPDKWHAAAGAVALRDWMPSFNSAPPSEQKAALDTMKAEPVTNDLQVATVTAAEKAYSESVKGWNSDPITQANLVLQEKPPALPAFDPANPKAYLDALAGRRQYGLRLQAQGYTKDPAFFTNDEAKALGAVFGKDVPAEMQLMTAQSLAQAFGPDAKTVFKEIGIDDPVISYTGQMLALGGSQQTAMDAIIGRQMLDTGQSSRPTEEVTIAAMKGFSEAFSGLQGGTIDQGNIQKLAIAIYAAGAVGLDPKSEAAKSLMRDAINRALGGAKDRRGNDTGGMQEIGGFKTLLPIGVSGVDANAALEKAFQGDGSNVGYGSILMDAVTGAIPGIGHTNWEQQQLEPDPKIWAKVGTGIPLLEGKPVPYAAWSKGAIRAVPRGDKYRLEIVNYGQPVTDIRDANGKTFEFDLQKLIEATQ